jgi:hypothetical protein
MKQEIVMNLEFMVLELVNTELQLVSDAIRDEEHEDMYQDFLEEMHFYWEMEQYASDSYDLDAQYYGELF